MNSSKFNALLDIITTNEYRTSTEIANYLKVTEKTARKYIMLLNDELKKYSAEIVGKQKLGFILEVKEKEKYNLFLHKYQKKVHQKFIPSNSEERVAFIIFTIVDKNNYIKKEELSEALFVSSNTLTNDLKKVEIILAEFKLKLIRKPNYGLTVEGNELEKRLVLVEMTKPFIFQNILPLMEQELANIRGVFMSNLKNNGVIIPDDSMEDLVYHAAISIHRIRQGYNIYFERKSLEYVFDEKIISIVREIASLLEYEFKIQFKKNEINYLTALMVTKMSSESLKKYVRIEDERINPRIEKNVMIIIENIYRDFKIDFRHNLDLKMNLIRHFLPMGLRLRYGLPLQNPMLKRIMKEYALAYTLASNACYYVFDDITKDEIGYVALIFALALEENKREITKKNIVFVCSTGKASSQFFVYKYRQEFGDYIDNIYECTVNNLNNFDFQEKKIDYIFTTVPIVREVPVPIFEVDHFMSDGEIISYSQFFKRESTPSLLQYYSPQLFFTNLESTTQENILKEMISKCREVLPIPSSYYDSVMRREKANSTSFGNLVAIPHPEKSMLEESFVAVGILQNPVVWGKHDVQVIFLISLSDREDKNLQNFYETTTSFLFNTTKMNSLISHPTYEHLMDLLHN